jgi:signal transduction histidine kinase
MSLTYAVNGVFRYEFKNKKVAYIFSVAIAVFAGVAGDVGYILFPTVYEAGEYVIDGEVIARLILTFIHFVVLLFMLRGKFWKRLLALFLTNEIIGSLIHIFEDFQFQLVDLFNWENESNQRIAALILELTTMLFMFLFLFLIARIRRKNDNTPLSLPVMGVVTVFMLLTNSLIADEYNSPIVVGADIAKPILLMLILVTLGLFFFLRSTSKERDSLKQLNKINEELMDTQAKFFEASAKADSEIRAMRHDMRNNTQVLMLLLESGEYDKMREYLEEMSEGLAGTNVSSHTGDVIADAIIADKKKRAANAGIALNVTGAITGVEISPVNMCKMLGNLLDNAIEAASNPGLKELAAEYKVIDLQFKHTENFFMISVTNPCVDHPKIKDGKIVTSKSDKKNHGFGISNIRSAAEDCGGELSVSCEEKPFGFLFRAEVVI